MKKKLILSVLALLGMTQAVAQEYEYIPFVREGVKWVCDNPYLNSEWMHLWDNIFTLELSGDTVINGKCYKAMHKYSGTAIDEANDTIPVYLREEDKVVYGIVPDGRTYAECPVGMNWMPEAREAIENGQEFILYDFNDPINFIKNNIKYPRDGGSDVYQFDRVASCQILVAGKWVNSYIFGPYGIIEGIGCDGIDGYPLSALCSMKLYYVIENGDTIYIGNNIESKIIQELPIPRQGVQWVNEKVTISNGDTTSYYYKYEFHGSDSQGFAQCYSYTGEALSPYARLVALYQSWDYGSSTSNGMMSYNVPFKKVKNEGRDMVDYYSSIGSGYLEMYHFEKLAYDSDPGYTPNWYISRQKDNFLTREDFVEVEPLTIEGIRCDRFAYIGENGDTLAYVVEGIGFDSYDMGDLLTPFTKRPDPTADYQEYCGLSHVVKDGKIIYKGMRYRHGAFTGIDEVDVADRTPRPVDPHYYNLMGQPVGTEVPTAPGIYIHNGNKIIVR